MKLDLQAIKVRCEAAQSLCGALDNRADIQCWRVTHNEYLNLWFAIKDIPDLLSHIEQLQAEYDLSLREAVEK